MANKKFMGLGCLAVVILSILIFAVYATGVYNSLVGLDQKVQAQWGQVENTYQRRADLIPNLVETVKGAAAFEKDTYTAVTEARAKVGQVQVNPGQLTPDAFAKFQQAQDGLSSALSRLLVVVEKYPELKATENFKELQAQLEGTENRITVERMRFDGPPRPSTRSATDSPTVIIAGFFGKFAEKPYFKSPAGAGNRSQGQVLDRAGSSDRRSDPAPAIAVAMASAMALAGVWAAARPGIPSAPGRWASDEAGSLARPDGRGPRRPPRNYERPTGLSSSSGSAGRSATTPCWRIRRSRRRGLEGRPQGLDDRLGRFSCSPGPQDPHRGRLRPEGRVRTSTPTGSSLTSSLPASGRPAGRAVDTAVTPSSAASTATKARRERSRARPPGYPRSKASSAGSSSSSSSSSSSPIPRSRSRCSSTS